VFIVAELSANHAGRMETAVDTIRAAAKCGADAIKLQTYTPDTITLKSDAPPFVVKTNNEWKGRTLHDLYGEAMTPWEWHEPLQKIAREEGLILFSTPFDVTATEHLERLHVPVHKIASFEITDLPLVEHVARRGHPMIISTGMASLEEIEAAVQVCRDAGNDAIALLRCVSAYPARPETMDLASFAELKRFGTVVGLSDHTRGVTVPVASVALGAKVIEKHFIVDRAVGGPDAFFSLDPVEFRAMVDAVRTTEQAMGRPRFGPGEDERTSYVFRRSLFFARDVRAGQVITSDDVRSVRPANGLPARHLPEILGRLATRDLAAGTPVTWEHASAPSPARATLKPDSETESRRSFQAHGPEGEVVGEVSLAVEAGGSGRVTLAMRGSRYGADVAADVVRAVEAEARIAGLRALRTEIAPGDEAMLRAFQLAGYYSFVARVRGADGGELYVHAERRVAPYHGGQRCTGSP
jgi:pseudaminic acid synthase